VYTELWLRKFKSHSHLKEQDIELIIILIGTLGMGSGEYYKHNNNSIIPTKVSY